MRRLNVLNQASKQITLSAFHYDEANCSEKNLEKPEDCLEYKSRPGVSWINVDGGLAPDLVEKIGGYFDVHPLVIEDILQPNQRPKLEEFDHYLYVVLKMFSLDKNNKTIIQERVCMILGENVLITFQEKPGDIFDPLRNKLRHNQGKIRKLGPDYLAYSLIDAVVDYYYIILEKISEQIEKLEDELMNTPTQKTIHAIHNLRNEMLFLMKSVWPLREVLDHLTHDETVIIKPTTVLYLRDVYDHTIQIMEQLEILRDIVSGMLDIYLSSINNKMNAVMKRLTLITTIFMPLTVIAGIGGMSEWTMMTGAENWKIAYPLFILVTILIGFITYLYFKWKQWT
jgi:magnesium transporter